MKRRRPVQHTIDSLNSYLRNELSAVDTYERAVENIEQLGLSELLDESRQSHLGRVELLRKRILQMGGQPSERSGPWELLSEPSEDGAKVDPKVHISALEEFEYHDLKRYRDELAKLDDHTRLLVREQVLPAQERTYRTIKSIRRTLA
jgi:bacterioferritin (cytochrome b1)